MPLWLILIMVNYVHYSNYCRDIELYAGVKNNNQHTGVYRIRN